MKRDIMERLIERYECANMIVNRRVNALLRDQLPDDITVDQVSMMRYIRRRPQCTSTELADMFCVGKSSITAIITRLADKHLIRRIPDEKDRRVTLLELTEEGERIVGEADARMYLVLEKYLAHFTEEEADAFIDMYERLAVQLQQEEGNGGEG